MSRPRLSVVIPTRNRRALLARTLPTVLAQDLPPADYEVIVVSDGSTDGTVEFLQQMSHTSPVALRVLDRPQAGLAAARNAGIHAATGPLVLLLDDDMLGEPALVSRHLAAHNGRPDVVIGSVETSTESRRGLATDFVRLCRGEEPEAAARSHTNGQVSDSDLE